jgi:hypothetical protein
MPIPVGFSWASDMPINFKSWHLAKYVLRQHAAVVIDTIMTCRLPL